MKTTLTRRYPYPVCRIQGIKIILLISFLLFSLSTVVFPQVSWYSYQSGNWTDTDWRTWTTDPSGTTLINPSHLQPGSGDNVVILNGRTVIIPAGTTGRTVASVTIQQGAVLDITNTTGHSFGTQLNGSGLLRLSTASFPSFAAGTFVQPGGGTVEYRNIGGFTLAQFTYNNLIINLDNSADEVLYNSTTALTINGHTTIERGILRIGDNFSTTQRYVYFNGDITVQANGGIGVGFNTFGNSTSTNPTTRSHQIAIRGNLYNNGGVVKFTNMTTPVYNYAPPTSPNSEEGWSDVIFDNGSSDQYVVCNGTTVFYRMQIEKGTDQTYVLHVDADNNTRFRLMGRNDRQDYHPGAAPNITNLNAIGLLSGTVRFGPNIVIPSLSIDSYVVDEDAGIWFDGCTVSFNSSTLYSALFSYGTTRFSSNCQASIIGQIGIVIREYGNIIIESGNIETHTCRTSVLSGATHRGAFKMYGGTLTLSGYDISGATYQHATFSIAYPENVFIMTGGTIDIQTSFGAGGAANNFSLLLGSLPKNVNVTGGIIRISTTPRPAYVNSTVPLPNLEIYGTANTFQVRGITGIPALTAALPLVVQQNLSIQNTAVFNNTQNVNVHVGENFNLLTGTTYTPGNNTTIFDGTGSQTFNIQGTINGNLNNLTVTNAANLTMNNTSAAVPIVVKGNLQLDHGCSLIDNGRILEVQGNITNSGIHFKPVSGAGSIQLTGNATQVIGGDGTGSFNNLTLNKTGGTVSMQADMTLTGDLRLANSAARLNIGSYNLMFTSTADVFDNLSGTGKNFDRNRMIQTSGLMSDGGVSKTYSSTNAFLFPVGFYNTGNSTYYYMPASIRFSNAPATFGTVTTRPVNARQPLVQSNNSLACYWHTTSTGFTGIPSGSVVHNYTYDPLSNDFVSGTESAYIPAVYRGEAQAAWIYINNPVLVNDGTNVITYDTAYVADGEYTAGETDAFSAIPVRYSTGMNGDWDNTSTWSAVAVGGPGGASVPDANTIVIIGDETHNHTVTINQNNKVCGSLTIYNGSTLDLRNFTGHNFEAIPEKGVSGTGTLRIASNNYFPRGDFGDFIGESGGTVEYYTITPTPGSISIPVSSDVTALALDHYYNLVLNPATGSTITLPNSDLRVFNDFTKNGAGQVYTNTASAHAISVHHNLNIEEGLFEVRNTNIQTITVFGNMITEGTFRVQNSTAVNHALRFYGDLSGSGTFNASNGGRILTYFLGDGDASIRGAVKDFYSLEVNKGSSQLPVLNVRTVITTSFDPAVSLKNGTLRIKQSTLSLSNTRSFIIPETACLSIDSVANITVSNNNSNDSTLFLIGKLEILNGTMNIGNPSYNRRNCIEYSSDGTPALVVNGGILNVNGQIKRNSLTTQGSLRFTQTGGILNIYGKNQDVARAKLEICNDKSLLDLSGGTINIYRGGGVDFGDLYLRPHDHNITGGTINLGPAAAIGNQVYDIDATCNLHNLNITSYSGGNTATAFIMVNPLVLSGDLTIGPTNSTLNSNNKNVSIAGNFVNNGIYNPGTNSTIFIGSNDQTATFGVSTVFNKLMIDKPAGSSVDFTGTIDPVVNDSLTINNGTLINSGTRNILANGNIINKGIHASSGSGSLIIQGSYSQLVSGNSNGQFGNVTLNNGAANGLTLTANTTINGLLTLVTGYFYVNDYLLSLSSTASIGGSPGIPANKNWIITNGVLSDAGIKKEYPAVSPSSFTFPIGVAGKYTPVTFNVTYTAASPGSITIKPVNIKIPSLTNALADELQYYWNVTSTPFGGMGPVTHTYNYLQADVTGVEANYVGARYYNNTWTNLGAGVMNIGNNTITLTQNYIDGEYTCGEPGNFLNKPVYYSYDLAPDITTTGADWNTAGSWATGGHNGTPATLPPDGNPIIIKAGHRINVVNDDRLAYSIANSGILNLNNTVGHSFGHVSGDGRIIMSNTTAGQFVFPGGDYSGFMNTTGSTIEYYGATGPLASSISPTVKIYQNLEFTGPINKNMSCVDILVMGNLLITESQLINTSYNREITLWGDWTNEVTNGFVPGRGTVTFNGASLQTIHSPDQEHFYNFRINNSAGVTLDGQSEIANRLYLVNGRVNTTDTDLLTITNGSSNSVSGGSDASFVDGPLRKLILNGQSFGFPVGNYNASAGKPERLGNIILSDVSATNYWKAQYVNADPESYYSRLSMLAPLTSVSDNEYWIVTRPGGNTANVSLRWDDQSGIASVNSTRVTEWVTPANRWEEKGSLVSGSLSAGNVTTTTPVTTDSYVFTLGVSGVTARITNVAPAEICNNGEVVTVTVVLTGSPNWTLTYTAGGSTYVQSGISSGTYNIQLTGTDLGGAGLRDIWLTAVSDAYNSGTVDPTVYQVTVKNTYIPDIQGTFTVGSGEVRNYLTSNNPGSTYFWDWQGASGGIIATPDAASTDITITIPGTYPTVYQLQVTETSANGCIASDIQAITVVNTPSPEITPDDANLCQGDVVNYSTPLIAGHTYTWTVTGGTPASGTGNTIAVTWNTVGNGSVSVVEDNSGITGSDAVNLVVDPPPNTGLLVSGPASVCDGNIAIITVAGSESGFSYQLREGAVEIGTAVAGTGGIINLPSGILTADATFNVLAYNNGCSEQLTQTVSVTINDPPAPTGNAIQAFCAIINPSVDNLIATGTNLQWYATATGGTPLPGTTELMNGSIYYATQTISGCESTTRLAVTVTISDPAAPTGNATQAFCAISNPTVASLTATGTGIQWYSTATGGTPLPVTTALVNGNTYYASQIIGGCESTTRLAVIVTVSDPAAPTGNATQAFCALSNPTVASLTATGTGIQWYPTATGGTSLPGTTALVNGNTYYASQTIGGCESTTRLAVTVTVSDPASPTGNVAQAFCAISNPTVANLTATGTGIQWYATATGGTPLPGTTALMNGNIYYASQTIGGCESTTRLAVTVTVSDPAAPTGNTTQAFCAISNPTVVSLTATGTGIQWYATAISGTPLPGTTALVNGYTYYASQTIGACESVTRLAVTVTVSDPAAPTGNATQAFCAISNPTVVSLTAIGTGIQWYATATGGTPLPGTTALVDGNTYYASQTIGGCESVTRLAVMVIVSENPVTSAISGNSTPLCQASGVVYSVVLHPGSTYEWMVPENAVITSGITGPNNNQISVDFGTISGFIQVIETNQYGCTGEPVQLAIELQACNYSAKFTADDTVICQNESVLFTDQSEGTNPSTTYEWNFGTGAIPATANTRGPHGVTYASSGAKSVQLIIANNGISDTLLLSDYITVHAIPAATIEDESRCGAGDIIFEAEVEGGDQVDFSDDGGASVLYSDNSAPYTYTTTLSESSAFQLWVRAYNTVTGCYGEWDQSAIGVAYELPVTERIQAADAGLSAEGYVDVVCLGETDALYYVNADPTATYHWQIPELGIEITGVTQLEVDWNVPPGDYTIELQKISDDGCTGAVRDTMVMVAQPEPDLGGSISICEGESYTFSFDEEYYHYQWHDFSENDTYTTSETGEIYVKVWDEYGCSGSDTAYLTVYDNPVVNLGNDTTLCGSSSLVLDAGDFEAFDWSTGQSTNTVVVYSGAGPVSVTVTDEHGCQATDEIVILECSPEILLGTIANAFTPNMDGYHDSWEINNIHMFPNATIKVFDRWGRIVFEVKGGYDNNWYGTTSDGKDLPVDTYYYIIDLKINGIEPITGTVNIIR
jgi:gliding motility-associated-like protein